MSKARPPAGKAQDANFKKKRFGTRRAMERKVPQRGAPGPRAETELCAGGPWLPSQHGDSDPDRRPNKGAQLSRADPCARPL